MEFDINKFMYHLDHGGKDKASKYLKDNPTDELEFPCFLTEATITYRGLKVLGEILKTDNTVKTLSFQGSYINDTVLEAIAEGLKCNKTITKLDLSKNVDLFIPALDDTISVSSEDSLPPKSGKIIGSILAENSTLEELILGRTGLDDKVAIEISKGLSYNRTLKKLDVSHNNIGKGAANIATAIQNRGQNCDLDLSYNKMTDKEAMALSTMLKKCECELEFSNNPAITKVGEKILPSQLQKNGNMPDPSRNVNTNPSKVQRWCDKLSKQEDNLNKQSGGRS